MIIFITLSFAGAESGPFDLYSDVDGFTTPFAQNISKADLLGGYEVEAPDGTTTVRLLDLGADCTPFTTDIYNCATPNCDFSGEILCPYENCDFSGTIVCPAADCNFTGEILCPVTTTTSTSTSTTTTTAAPTTTTTTTSYPLFSPCTWSTYGGNSGEIAVYDFNTNSSTSVLVPNDFTTTQGINRPICSTEDKLWLASVTTDNTVAYIREWDINTSGPTPTLSYVREITVYVANLDSGSIYGRTISTIAVNSDNSKLLVGFGAIDQGGSVMGIYKWDISTLGDIALSQQNSEGNAGVSFGNTSGITTELTGTFITNDNNVIVSARYYKNPEAQGIVGSNRVRQYEGLDLSSWGAQSTPVINLQQRGVPDFTTNWTNVSKAMPVWGVNGLLQVIQPETLQVYNIDQIGPYDATLSGTVADNTVWIHTSTGCANVDIIYEDCEGATWIPALTEQDKSGDWVYTGPATFTYAGIEVTASASQDNMKLQSGDRPGGVPIGGCSGISNPPGTNVLGTLKGFDFTITLSFSQPVNNIPIRAAVLNSQPDFSYGDVYTFDTNTGTPNVSISVGCNVQVQGNSIGGGVPDYGTEGDGEFIISSDENYTVLTISGDAPTGGPLLLGCLEVEKNCTWATPFRGSAGADTVFIYNPIANTYLPQSLPNGFGSVADYKRGNFSSENILFFAKKEGSDLLIKRYDIGQGLTYIDEIVVTAPSGEQFSAPSTCAMDDNTLLLNTNQGTLGYVGKIYKLVINSDGTTTLTFLFTLESERPYWTSPIFSNNKIIYQRVDTQDIDTPRYIVQRDYATLDIELEINVTYLSILDTEPDGYVIQNSNQSMFFYEDKMYILVSGIKLYEIDTTFPYNTTLINENTEFFGAEEFNNQYLRAWSNSGECSSNLSFIPSNETTTTTTSTTTLPPDAPSTIWIKFDPVTPV